MEVQSLCPNCTAKRSSRVNNMYLINLILAVCSGGISDSKAKLLWSSATIALDLGSCLAHQILSAVLRMPITEQVRVACGSLYHYLRLEHWSMWKNVEGQMCNDGGRHY
jgi:hypothetical protein